MKLGLHTYSLYHHGVGQAWTNFELPWGRQLTMFQIIDLAHSFGLEGLHVDDGSLESGDRSYLEEVKAAADQKGFYLEYNFTLDFCAAGVGIVHDFQTALEAAQTLGADVVKVSLDMPRPRPVAASRFHPEVHAWMDKFQKLVRPVIPDYDSAGVKIAVENHCDFFSEELLWLLDQIDHPVVGACVDTVNAFHVTEDPTRAVENLAPRGYTNHFRDDRVVFQRDGFKVIGAAVGDGDLDMVAAYRAFKEKSPMKRINIETEMGFPLDDKDAALAGEIEAIRRSVRYCRDVLKIGSD